YLQTINGESGQYTILHGFFETFLYSRNKFLGYVTPLHFIDEDQSRILGITTFYLYNYIGKFTTTSRLFLIYLPVIHGSVHGLFIRYLGSALVHLYLEFPSQTVNNDIQVKLTHTTDNGLTGLFIRVDLECRIFFREL